MGGDTRCFHRLIKAADVTIHKWLQMCLYICHIVRILFYAWHFSMTQLPLPKKHKQWLLKKSPTVWRVHHQRPFGPGLQVVVTAMYHAVDRYRIPFNRGRVTNFRRPNPMWFWPIGAASIGPLVVGCAFGGSQAARVVVHSGVIWLIVVSITVVNHQYRNIPSNSLQW